MRFDKPVPVTTIAKLIGAEITGNSNGLATGINELNKALPGDLVFVDHPKYYDKALKNCPSGEEKRQTTVILRRKGFSVVKVISTFRINSD